MLTIIDEKHADLEAIQNLELIHVTAASVPNKNFEALKAELAKFPLILSDSILNKSPFCQLSCSEQPGRRDGKNR